MDTILGHQWELCSIFHAQTCCRIDVTLETPTKNPTHNRDGISALEETSTPAKESSKNYGRGGPGKKKKSI